MKPKSRTNLEEMREDLRKQLTTELAAPAENPKAIAILVSRMEAIEALARLQPPDQRKKWRVPTLIAATAVALVGIASLIHLRRIAINIDASISEFRMQLGAQPQKLEGDLSIKPGSFMAAGLVLAEETADPVANFAAFTALQDIHLDGASAITFDSKPGRCFELRIQKGALHGTVLRSGKADSEMVPWSVKMHIPARGFLRFCPREESHLFVEGLEAMSVSTILHAYPPPEVHGPSILKGELNLPSTNEHRALSDKDRLSLKAIQDGRLAVRFGETLRLSFSGSTSDPKLFALSGPESAGGEDLRPTLAGVARSSPKLTAILASVVGVATALMGALQWFGLRAKE